eukprot:1018070-Amphidinium_carterae.2
MEQLWVHSLATEMEVHQHLRGEGVAPDLYLQQWLLTMFANTLPLPAVLHLWDLVQAVQPDSGTP